MEFVKKGSCCCGEAEKAGEAGETGEAGFKAWMEAVPRLRESRLTKEVEAGRWEAVVVFLAGMPEGVEER